MEYQLNETVLGLQLSFKTNDKCFSPKRLDAGTKAMLSHVALHSGLRILDLGCGYGIVGIACAKIIGQENIVMTDISPLAVSLSKENAKINQVPFVHVVQSDGFNQLDESGFDIILCNPPYHCDFNVAKRFIEKGFNRLKIGGRMLMVTKRREWYKQKFISIFGGVKIWPTDGYCVFEAEKTTPYYANKRKI